MAKTKSLYELKQDQMKKKNPNQITDSDYYLRDKIGEAKNTGNANVIFMGSTKEKVVVEEYTKPKKASGAKTTSGDK